MVHAASSQGVLEHCLCSETGLRCFILSLERPCKAVTTVISPVQPLASASFSPPTHWKGLGGLWRQ